jgi:hypothetical protein
MDQRNLIISQLTTNEKREDYMHTAVALNLPKWEFPNQVNVPCKAEHVYATWQLIYNTKKGQNVIDDLVKAMQKQRQIGIWLERREADRKRTGKFVTYTDTLGKPKMSAERSMATHGKNQLCGNEYQKKASLEKTRVSGLIQHTRMS